VQKLIALKQIKDNPYRDKKRNPIDQDKVESIAESIDSTKSFWKGVYGREVEGGYVELAFGHHRLDAARLAGLAEIPIELEEFSDGDMLMWMARENVQGSIPIMMEAISGAVRALAEGKLEVEAISKDTKKEYIRYAPSFIPGKQPAPAAGARPYTLKTLAKALGGNYIRPSDSEPKDTTVAAMARLVAEERGWLANMRREDLDKMDYRSTIKNIGNIARMEKAKETSVREIQRVEQEAIETQRKLEAERKEREKKLEAQKQESLRKEAEARIEENKREVARQQQRRKDLEERAEEKKVIDSIKMSALEAKVEEKKRQVEEAKKKDDYALILRDVECLLGHLDSTKARLGDNIKALAKRALSLKDRQRVWETLYALSDWAGGWAAAQFAVSGVPRYSTKKTKRKK
jgi:hypothetical protein